MKKNKEIPETRQNPHFVVKKMYVFQTEQDWAFKSVQAPTDNLWEHARSQITLLSELS